MADSNNPYPQPPDVLPVSEEQPGSVEPAGSAGAPEGSPSLPGGDAPAVPASESGAVPTGDEWAVSPPDLPEELPAVVPPALPDVPEELPPPPPPPFAPVEPPPPATGELLIHGRLLRKLLHARSTDPTEPDEVDIPIPSMPGHGVKIGDIVRIKDGSIAGMGSEFEVVNMDYDTGNAVLAPRLTHKFHVQVSRLEVIA
jgi:hypothetical protein